MNQTELDCSSRTAGLNTRFQMKVFSQLTDCSSRCERFQYDSPFELHAMKLDFSLCSVN